MTMTEPEKRRETPPWNVNGHRMMTRLAGKFTPEDSVEVATSTRKMPFLNAPSMMSRSSKVRPE